MLGAGAGALKAPGRFATASQVGRIREVALQQEERFSVRTPERAGETPSVEVDLLQDLAPSRLAPNAFRGPSAYHIACSSSRQMPSGWAPGSSAHARRFDRSPSTPMSKAGEPVAVRLGEDQSCVVPGHHHHVGERDLTTKRDRPWFLGITTLLSSPSEFGIGGDVAFRRATIKEQFDAAISAVLEPGEEAQAETLSQSGPSPWLAGVGPAGVIGWLNMLIAGDRYYFIVVTDRRVLFMKASMMTGRPRGLAWADPRGAVEVSDVNLTNAVWSKFRYHRPDAEDIHLNVHRFWRNDGLAVVNALTARA